MGGNRSVSVSGGGVVVVVVAQGSGGNRSVSVSGGVVCCCGAGRVVVDSNRSVKGGEGNSREVKTSQGR
jgi:hypothetical protein